jgi:hypothetical protein
MDDDVRPSDDEIREELNSILASPAFRTRKAPSDMLRLLVERALQGRRDVGGQDGNIAPTEEEILHALFTHATRQAVRTTATIIRKNLLPKYYDGEGRDNRVRISLPSTTVRGAPKSTAYVVKFAYRTHTEDRALFKTARQFLARYYPEDVTTALVL